jgi:hypothetical protein
MKFEDLLIDLYPINNKNNKFKKFVQHNIHGELLISYIEDLAVYMVAATKVSGVTILEKILYDNNRDDLTKLFKIQKEEIKKEDIYFELIEEEKGYFFMKANEVVIAIIEDDIQLFRQLQTFILD